MNKNLIRKINNKKGILTGIFAFLLLSSFGMLANNAFGLLGSNIIGQLPISTNNSVNVGGTSTTTKTNTTASSSGATISANTTTSSGNNTVSVGKAISSDNVVSSVNSTVKTVNNTAISAANQTASTATSAANNATKTTTSTVKTVNNTSANTANQTTNTVVSAVNNATQTTTSTIKTINSTSTNTANQTTNTVVSAANNATQQQLPAVISTVNSTVTNTANQAISTALLQISNTQQQLSEAQQQISSDVQSSNQTANQAISTAQQDVSGAQQTLSSVQQQLPAVISTVNSTVTSTASQEISTALQQISNAQQQISSVQQQLSAATSSANQTATSTANQAELIASDQIANTQLLLSTVQSTLNAAAASAVNTTTSTVTTTAQTAITILPPPTGLTATAISPSQINLSWNAPSVTGLLVSGYKIERSVNNGNTWSTIVSNTGSTTTTYSDTGLAASTTYTYRVSAIYLTGTSQPSNTATATTTSTTDNLFVTSQLTTGGSLTGMFAYLMQNGQVVESGFTPVTFILNNTSQYSVGVDDFPPDTFDHWLDTGSTINPRLISISSDTQVTAVFKDTDLTLSPSSGPVGTTVTVTGTTFSNSAKITLTWDGTTLTTNPATITSNSNGGFNATFQVPSTASAGSHTVQATDGTNTHSTTFTVSAASAISLNANSVNVGTDVRVTGTNFSPNSLITLSFDGDAIGQFGQDVGSGSATPTTVTTDSNGNFVAIMQTLVSVSGTHTISAQDSMNNAASQSVTVSPHAYIFPTTGKAGSTILIPASQGNGFAANSTITIKFDGTTIIPSSSITTDTTGDFGGSFTVPSAAASGSHTITMSDASGNTFSTSFTVDPNAHEYSGQVVASGINFPGYFAFIPDNGQGVDGSGAFMVNEKNTGNVDVFKNVNGQFVKQSVAFVTVPNLQTNYETNGLLGIAFDPNWAGTTPSKYVYLYVTRNQTVNGAETNAIVGELIRYHATTDSSGNIIADTSVGEQLVLGNIPAFENGHNGGSLKFDSQGNLYISTGDGWTFTAGQILTTLQAKILRITPLASPVNGQLYSIPSTNPFASSTTDKKEIWGYGVRHPYAFDIDSQTGKLYASNTGFNTWEAIENFTAPASNAGWPNYEAPPYGNTQNLANYVPPIYWYSHQGVEPLTGTTAGLEALSAGAFYHGTAYPSNLQGAYFFGDYGVGNIVALLPASVAPPTMDTTHGSPISQVVPILYGLTNAPIYMEEWNGKLYFLDLNGNVNVLNYN